MRKRMQSWLLPRRRGQPTGLPQGKTRVSADHSFARLPLTPSKVVNGTHRTRSGNANGRLLWRPHCPCDGSDTERGPQGRRAEPRAARSTAWPFRFVSEQRRRLGSQGKGSGWQQAGAPLTQPARGPSTTEEVPPSGSPSAGADPRQRGRWRTRAAESRRSTADAGLKWEEASGGP